MTRILAVPLLLALTAAAPSKSIPQTLSLPSPPPPSGPVYAPAPVPNPDAGAPTTPAPSGAEITPNLFTQNKEYKGEGYLPGSSFQSDEASPAKRSLLPAPGATLKVPLY